MHLQNELVAREANCDFLFFCDWCAELPVSTYHHPLSETPSQGEMTRISGYAPDHW